jgi:metal-sulfur cluster biosynthetic enzyme
MLLREPLDDTSIEGLCTVVAVWSSPLVECPQLQQEARANNVEEVFEVEEVEVEVVVRVEMEARKMHGSLRRNLVVLFYKIGLIRLKKSIFMPFRSKNLKLLIIS